MIALATKSWVKELVARVVSVHKGGGGIKNFRWLRFDPNNRKGVIIKKDASIVLADGKTMIFEKDKAFDLSSDITAAGKDYFIFIDTSGSVRASESDTANSNEVKIGRCHTLCADVGNITMIAPAAPSSGLVAGGKYLVKPYRQDEDPDFYAFYNKDITAVTKQSAYDVVTCTHPLAGFVAGDILPESIFCRTFHPSAMFEDAMVYDKGTGIAVDVYLQSGTGLDTRSAFGATHTVNRTAYNHQGDFICVGKQLLDDQQFTSAALGSNERTAITGSTDQTTVGGHVDTAGRRMISAIGCEEMCGYLWQWLNEMVGWTNGNWVTTDAHGSFGQEYGNPYVLRAGGSWYDSSRCGSRSRASAIVRSGVSGCIGGRGSSRISNDF